jgi:hypothetical protein
MERTGVLRAFANRATQPEQDGTALAAIRTLRSVPSAVHPNAELILIQAALAWNTTL